MEKLSWKEKYVAILLLFIGFVYLAIWLISVFSETTGFVNVGKDNISINKWELLNHTRSVLTFLFAICGGLLILSRKTLGWILGFPILVLFLIICGGGIYQAISLGETRLAAFAGTTTLLLLFAFVILLLPTSRRRLRVGASGLLTGILLAAGFAAFFLMAQ